MLRNDLLSAKLDAVKENSSPYILKKTIVI